MLVVLSMAGVVVGMQVMQQFERAKVDLAVLQLRQVQNALTLFEIDSRRYPSAEEGIEALLTPPSGLDTWRGPYVRTSELLVDPWGQPIRYATEGENYRITSLGSDKKTDGEGVAADLELAGTD